MKPQYLWDPVHEEHFWIVVNMPIKEMEAWIKKHYKLERFELEHSCHHAAGFVFEVHAPDGRSGIWIYIKGRKLNCPLWLSTVAHEAVHAGKALMHERGFDMTHRYDEPLAYMVSFLVKHILRVAKSGKI